MKNIYKVLLFSFVLSSSIVNAQKISYIDKEIPLVDNKVVFSIDFNKDLSKTQFSRFVYYYLNHRMKPYKGGFYSVSKDSIKCNIVDFLEISTSALYSFGVYIEYDINFAFEDGKCNMTIDNIIYMGKTSYEEEERLNRDLRIVKLTGKEIMIDKKYRSIFIRNSSDKITEATINMINSIIDELNLLFIEVEN